MIKAYILDDEDHCIDHLTRYVSKCDDLHLVGSSINHREALEQIRAGNVDLLFLDINMPEIQGTELASLIDDDCEIIFTTGFPEYAVEAFELRAIDYLLKPFSFGRFLDAVGKYKEKIQKSPADTVAVAPVQEPTYLFFKSGPRGKYVKVNPDDIRYVEYRNDYVIIHSKDNKKLMAHGSMKEMEECLPAQTFIRVHRGYMVSLHYIGEVEGNQVILNDSTTRIDIHEQYRDRFRKAVLERTFNGR